MVDLLGHLDGYRVECDSYLTRDSRRLFVRVVLRLGGEVQKQFLIWEEDDTPANRGQWQQQGLLWDALCRYLTTGGKLQSLWEIIDKLSLELPEVNLPPGTYLYSTRLFDPGLQGATAPGFIGQHIFVNESLGKAVVFTEDQYVETVSAVEVLREHEHG